MSDIELLPCPFCGGKPVKVRVGLSEAYSYADKVVYTCSGCGVSRGAIGDCSKGGYAENSTVEARAIEKWNMRAGYTALDMTTAAAQGFRDGRKSVGLLLGKGFNTLNQVGGKYSITLAFQDADDAYAAYTEIATIVRLGVEP